ncbi:MAG: SCO family protein [Planctomycetota bacterium]
MKRMEMLEGLFHSPGFWLALFPLGFVIGLLAACEDAVPGPEVAVEEEAAAAAPMREERIETDIPDVELVDQHGRTHRFYSDLIQGKLVLMNAIYTSCAGTCPMQTSIFSSVQKHLGDRVGQDVQMISVSLDPLNDKPSRLKMFAEKYGAKPGWIFLTGDKEDVRIALEAMDLYAPNPEDHTPICALGNDDTGVWMKLINLSSPDEIVSRLHYVAQLDPASFRRD